MCAYKHRKGETSHENQDQRQVRLSSLGQLILANEGEKKGSKFYEDENQHQIRQCALGFLIQPAFRPKRIVNRFHNAQDREGIFASRS